VDGVEEEFAVGGEVLEEYGVGSVALVDGELLAGWEGVEELCELVAQVHLVFELEIGDVEEDDVEDGWGVEDEVVVVGAAGLGGSGSGGLGEGCGGVLLKGGDVLRGVAVEDVKGGFVKVPDGVAVVVGDGDVGEDEAGVGVEGEGGLVGCGGRRGLGEESGGKEQRGEAKGGTERADG